MKKEVFNAQFSFIKLLPKTFGYHKVVNVCNNVENHVKLVLPEISRGLF